MNDKVVPLGGPTCSGGGTFPNIESLEYREILVSRNILYALSYYMEDFTKVRRKNASNQAIELLARNMNLNHQDIADKIGVSRPTIVSWMSHPEFIDAVYNRYMELAGTELPAVVQAMICLLYTSDAADE